MLSRKSRFVTVRVVAAGALVTSLLPLTGAASSSGAASCSGIKRIDVPRAEKQEKACLEDLTTKGTVESGHTNRSDWSGLHAKETKNPSGVPGIQVDGYFPDESRNNSNNGWFHDSQFVIRLPNQWNGKLVITGAPGVRRQYANDYIISDWVLARGYAFASTDKGNTEVAFYEDGSDPADAVAEWHRRVAQLTRASKAVVRQRYGTAPKRTYVAGISNGGYLTRWALENNPKMYDGGVDWEGTFFRPEGPNLFTFLPVALRNYPEYRANGSEQAHDAMIKAGFEPGSEFLWDYHYTVYWDLTQRVYREEFDPGYDGAMHAGVPFCQEGTPNCDANYEYESRPQEVKDAVARISNTGDIGKKMLTLHGTFDALLPIDVQAKPYRDLVEEAGRARRHRFYVIEAGNHVDGLYNEYPQKLRPILPCFRAAFIALERWVQKGTKPPANQVVPKPEDGGVNSCSVGGVRYAAK